MMLDSVSWFAQNTMTSGSTTRSQTQLMPLSLKLLHIPFFVIVICILQMNVLSTKAVKQIGTINKELCRLEDIIGNTEDFDKLSASLQGELVVALTLLGQVIKDMDQVNSREMDMSRKLQYRE